MTSETFDIVLLRSAITSFWSDSRVGLDQQKGQDHGWVDPMFTRMPFLDIIVKPVVQDATIIQEKG